MIRSCFSGLEMTRNIQDDFRSRQTLSKCDVVTVVEDSYHIRGVCVDIIRKVPINPMSFLCDNNKLISNRGKV